MTNSLFYVILMYHQVYDSNLLVAKFNTHLNEKTNIEVPKYTEDIYR